MNPNRYLPVLAVALMVGGTGVLLASDDERKERNLLPQPVNVTWQAECGSCHVAYPPALLPERSWRKLMAGLRSHFGEDASLDPAATREITEYLAAHSAGRSDLRRGRKVAQSVPDGDAPLRISATRWFRHEHDDIDAGVWKRPSIGSAANCGACHQGAAKGFYSEGDVKIPR
jgi:cytochrome c553